MQQRTLHLVAATRFFLLFLTIALNGFQWQGIVADKWGSQEGPANLGIANSLGTFSALAAVLANVYRRRTTTSSRYLPAWFFLLNATSWMIATELLHLSTMLIVNLLYSATVIMFVSSEIARVQENPSLDFGRIRIGGSLGFLLAAYLTQYDSGGGLLGITSLTAMTLLIRPKHVNDRALENDTHSAAKPLRNARNVILICCMGLCASIASKGFDMYVPIHLREQSNVGMYWLTLLIAVETLTLLNLSKIPATALIGLSVFYWALAYAALLYASNHATFTLAMVMAGLNCPVAVSLQKRLDQEWKGAQSQALFACSCGLGGVISSLLLREFLEHGTSILMASLLICIALSPINFVLLLSCRIRRHRSKI